jgi:tol-pal system protein YbgF
MNKYSFLLLLALCGCAKAQQPDTLPPIIDNSSYPDSAPPPATTAAPSSNAVYELMGRLDRLQAEVQQLTGKVEEQGNQIAELKKQQSTMYSDMDARLQVLEKGGKPAEPVATTETPTAPAVPAETTPAVAEAPKTIAVPVEPQAAPPATPTAKPVSAAPQPEVQASGSEKQAYQQAYSFLRSGKTDQSIEQFKNYLSQYPTGGYADLATYWLGEAYRVKPDPNAARQTFNTVLEKYPNSTKVADTLLKLGYVEAEQKNNDKAREYLNRVSTEFPNTAAAHAAAKKLAQLK